MEQWDHDFLQQQQRNLDINLVLSGRKREHMRGIYLFWILRKRSGKRKQKDKMYVYKEQEFHAQNSVIGTHSTNRNK